MVASRLSDLSLGMFGNGVIIILRDPPKQIFEYGVRRGHNNIFSYVPASAGFFDSFGTGPGHNKLLEGKGASYYLCYRYFFISAAYFLYDYNSRRALSKGLATGQTVEELLILKHYQQRQRSKFIDYNHHPIVCSAPSATYSNSSQEKIGIASVPMFYQALLSSETWLAPWKHAQRSTA